MVAYFNEWWLISTILISTNLISTNLISTILISTNGGLFQRTAAYFNDSNSFFRATCLGHPCKEQQRDDRTDLAMRREADRILR
jgi:hypothetical protein